MAKNRSLRAVYYRLGKIDTIIHDIINENGSAKVLEVGCGFGLPMLELKGKFRSRLNIIGINKNKEFNLPKKAVFEGLKKLRFYALLWMITKKYIGYPTYVNCDASLRLPFEDNTFDFIYSIVSTGFFDDKIHFLEEVNRILKPGSAARIHFPIAMLEVQSNFTVEENPKLIEILSENGLNIAVKDHFVKYPFIKFVTQSKGRTEFLELTKQFSTIDLELSLVDSINLKTINPSWVGYKKSIYFLKK